MNKFLVTVIFLATCIIHNISAYELSIATIFQNEAPYLKEWIEYHRLVGVEHFWLYNDASTDNWAQVLAPYIVSGIVEVIDWPTPSTAAFISYQCMAVRDALKKAVGISTWLALIDTDEFLLPMQGATVTSCLKKNFAHAAGIYINWHLFGTNNIRLQSGQSMLKNLTASSNKYHSCNSIGKSIVRPDCVKIDDVWNIHHVVLQPGKNYYNGDCIKVNFEGLDLKLDGKVHNKFIRINHYRMRDENFFHNVRLERTRRYGLPEAILWQHYYEFNKQKDRAIIHFMKQHHPESFQKWSQIIGEEHCVADTLESRCQKELAAALKQRHP